MDEISLEETKVVSQKYWDDEILYPTGDGYFDALECALLQAKVSVELESYIFEDDVLGRRIVEILAELVARRVRVRVLIDGFGSWDWISTLIPLFHRKRIDVRIYHPLPWMIHYTSSSYFRIFRLIANMNKRNHRKVCIIDGCQAWVGSRNISARHLESVTTKQNSHDLSVQVIGPSVSSIRKVFETAWKRSWPSKKKQNWWRRWNRRFRLEYPRKVGPLASLGVRSTDTKSARKKNYESLLKMFAESKKRVWIANAYFSPDFRLLKSLGAAVDRGVDLRLLVPQRSDVFFMPWITRTYYQALLAKGVRIYEYLPSFHHAKVILLDDVVIVGSSNLNRRSLFQDLELDLILNKEKSISGVEGFFETDFSSSNELNVQSAKAIGFSGVVSYFIAKILRRWI